MTRSSNATVLGVAPLWQTLPIVGAVLVALFVLMKPESTVGLGFLERLAYWVVHIGLGLASIGLASRLLRLRLLAAMPLALAILLTGLAGAAILSPVYLGMEALMPVGSQEVPDDWLDFLAQRGPLLAVLAEFLEVAPVFVASWVAVNLPLLFQRPEISGQPPGGSPDGSPGGRLGDTSLSASDEDPPSFLATLPRAIGSDIIAISSDMHYLHVHTALGRCMILGTLRDASASLGDAGMLVHRSHWMAHAHVRRLVRQGNQWKCLMSNGLNIPVSRRNRSKVLEWHGSEARVVRLQSRQTKRTAAGN